MREQTPPRSLSRWRRGLRKVVRGVLLAVASIIVLYVLSGVVFGILIWAENSRIKREGDPVTLADVIPPMPPDSENGAIIYEKAFRLVYTPYSSTYVPEKFPALNSLGMISERQNNPKIWEQANAELPKFLVVIKIVREAVSKPRCNYKTDWRKGAFPENSGARRLASLLRAYALLVAHNGDIDEAMRALKLAVKVGDSLYDCTLMSYLIRSEIYRSVGNSAFEIASGRYVSEKEIQAVSEAIAWKNLGHKIPLLVRYERATYNSAYEEIARTGFSHYLMIDPKDFGCDMVDSGRDFECSWFGRPVLLADHFWYLRAARRNIDDINIPFRKLPPPKPSGLVCDHSDEYGLFYDDLDFTISAHKMFDYGKARINGARLAQAACVYKRRFGEYPQSLSDISKLGWRLDTEDPFSGREFVYKPQHSGFLLYSLGVDLIDNGGKGDNIRTGYEQGSDIVWKVPLPRVERTAFPMPGKNAMSPPGMGPGSAGLPGMPGAPPNPPTLPGQSVR